jgi:hypothetical protein
VIRRLAGGLAAANCIDLETQPSPDINPHDLLLEDSDVPDAYYLMEDHVPTKTPLTRALENRGATEEPPTFTSRFFRRDIDGVYVGAIGTGAQIYPKQAPSRDVVSDLARDAFDTLCAELYPRLETEQTLIETADGFISQLDAEQTPLNIAAPYRDVTRLTVTDRTVHASVAFGPITPGLDPAALARHASQITQERLQEVRHE